MAKEFCLCRKLKFSNLYNFATIGCEILIIQTLTIWSNKNHSLKYLRSTTSGCQDIWIRKSELVSKTQYNIVHNICKHRPCFPSSPRILYQYLLRNEGLDGLLESCCRLVSRGRGPLKDAHLTRGLSALGWRYTGAPSTGEFSKNE